VGAAEDVCAGAVRMRLTLSRSCTFSAAVACGCWQPAVLGVVAANSTQTTQRQACQLLEAAAYMISPGTFSLPTLSMS
jgi:hypothetical protein